MYFSSTFTTYIEELHFRKGFSSAPFSVEYVWVAVSVFCVPCESKTSSLAGFFFQWFRLSNKFGNILEGPMRLIMLHCTNVVASLSCDYTVSSFLCPFRVYIYIYMGYIWINHTRTLFFNSVIWQTRNFVFIL